MMENVNWSLVVEYMGWFVLLAVGLATFITVTKFLIFKCAKQYYFASYVTKDGVLHGTRAIGVRGMTPTNAYREMLRTCPDVCTITDFRKVG